LYLGLRQGELLALTWEDVDFEQRTLTIRQSKTEAGRRTLTIPATLVDALRAHRVALMQERLVRGTEWHENNLVFPSEVGTPLAKRNLVRHFKATLKRAGLPDVRFHDLRHTAATVMLTVLKLPLQTVKDILGHSRISVTSDTYGHQFRQAFDEAADEIDRLFRRKG
jgi:integrase